MINLQPLYQVLRYILQAIIIYLLLRYMPFIQLETSKAIIVTIILTILLIAIEYLCYWCTKPSDENFQSVSNGGNLHSASSVENFQSTSCDSCKVDKIEPFEQKSQTNAPKCRIVCDGDNIKEGFEEIKPIEKRPEAPMAEEMPKRPAVVTQDTVRETQQEMVQNFGGMYYDENPYYNRYNNEDSKYSTNLRQELDTRESRDRERREIVDVNRTRMAFDEQAHSTKGYDTAYQEPGAKSEKRKGLDVHKRIEGDLDNELNYSDYNHLPVAEGYKSHDYEYGYSFIPPERWYPENPRAPICVTSKRENVCPMFTQGAPADVKEFFAASRITPPDQINVDYVKDKLNSGR